jgi:hypothetical protein
MFYRQKLPRGSITSRVAAKWGEDILDEGYVVFPKRLIRCLPAIFSRTGGMKELQVALAIADFLRPNLSRGPSVGFLAFLAGLDSAETKRALKSLKARGLVDYQGRDDELQINNAGLRKRILKETRESLDEEDIKEVD